MMRRLLLPDCGRYVLAVDQGGVRRIPDVGRPTPPPSINGYLSDFVELASIGFQRRGEASVAKSQKRSILHRLWWVRKIKGLAVAKLSRKINA